MEEEAGHSFKNQQLIVLLKYIRDKGWKVIQLVVRSVQLDSSVEEIAELVELIT